MPSRISIGAQQRNSSGLPRPNRRVQALLARPALRRHAQTLAYLWWVVLWGVCGGWVALGATLPTWARLPVFVVLGAVIMIASVQPLVYRMAGRGYKWWIIMRSLGISLVIAAALQWWQAGSLLGSLSNGLRQPLLPALIDVAVLLLAGVLAGVWFQYRRG